MPQTLTRVARGLLVMLLVTTAVQVLFALTPGTVSSVILGQDATPANIVALNHKLGLDRSILAQYLTWLGHALRSNLGVSPLTSQTVTGAIGESLPVTLELAVLGLVGALVLAIGFAILSALKPGGAIDRVLNAVSSVLLSVPIFVLGPLLIYVLAIKLSLLPVLGWEPLTSDIGTNLRDTAMPALSIVLMEVASFYRLLRADLISTLGEEFVDVARSKGLNPVYVMFRHALRPASMSLVTLIGVNVGRLIGGIVVVEQLFSLPGLGKLTITSIQNRDVITVEGIVAFVCVVYVAVNVLVDLSYGILDPRIRREARV